MIWLIRSRLLVQLLVCGRPVPQASIRWHIALIRISFRFYRRLPRVSLHLLLLLTLILLSLYLSHSSHIIHSLRKLSRLSLIRC